MQIGAQIRRRKGQTEGVERKMKGFPKIVRNKGVGGSDTIFEKEDAN